MFITQPPATNLKYSYSYCLPRDTGRKGGYHIQMTRRREGKIWNSTGVTMGDVADRITKVAEWKGGRFDSSMPLLVSVHDDGSGQLWDVAPSPKHGATLEFLPATRKESQRALSMPSLLDLDWDICSFPQIASSDSEDGGESDSEGEVEEEAES
ncbi:hypothetical protein CBER1_08731 [Cercospora berteroae]|uniref:Uncharacterized protein n=1 Tax=Cercospora berteroae TaxID=357750 RepID=A0A2S6CAB4_9PEZI|nr:hypothetical protein CBER1_08731 [Cercospora berteroae]